MALDRLNIVQDENCAGCLACLHVCPTGAIHCERNEEGFVVPVPDKGRCISCNRCSDVCPSLIPVQKKLPEAAFLVTRKSENTRGKSSSAGVFYQLATQWIQSGGAVCGAVLCDDLVIRHQVTYSLDGIVQMQGSKYVQSSIKDAVPVIKEVLRDGKRVLFCGTPCQVAAIVRLFPDEKEKLLCIDLICRGVPSPGWFEKYIRSTTSRSIEDICFRTRDAFERSGYNIGIVFKGSHIKDMRYSYLDTYMNLFMKGMNYRESCYRCRYAGIARTGDITLGDCGSFRQNRKWIGDRTPSTVLINTAHGLDAWKAGKEAFSFKPIDLQQEVKLNHSLHAPAKRPALRGDLGRDLMELSLKEIRNKYIVYSKKALIGVVLRRCVPSKLRAWIISGMKRRGEAHEKG